MFKYTNDDASFSPAAKRRSHQAQTDREQLQEITEIVFENANPSMSTFSNQEEFACAAVHCPPPPGIVHWSFNS